MTEKEPPFVDIVEHPPPGLAALSGEIAAQLNVVEPTLERRNAIASLLLNRVRQSAVAHRSFVTHRREDAAFVAVAVAEGAYVHILRSDAAVTIALVHLDAGAPLPWPDGVLAQEILVVQGILGNGCGNDLAQYQLTVQFKGAQVLRAGGAGAHLYTRQLISKEALQPAERLWWESPADQMSSGWLPLSEGVELKSLRCVGDVVSKLARVAPGATVGDHGHALDEDCMMLEGHLLLGDILLRKNDYQLAPAGGAHVNSSSDTGALFYFHGCLPGLH